MSEENQIENHNLPSADNNENDSAVTQENDSSDNDNNNNTNNNPPIHPPSSPSTITIDTSSLYTVENGVLK